MQSIPSSAAARQTQPAPAARTQNDAFVRIENVVKKFGDSTAVDNVNLTIAKNELFALLGSSGCGKSTLLRMLAGAETATSGKIFVDGEDLASLPPYRRPVNMMFQSYALFPHMTVESNVAFGLKQEGTPKHEIKERVADALALVQMSKYAQRKPHQLSGGQQQRVALARSLVKRPKLLLLDEPMSALDKKIRQKTQLELVNIIEKVDVTCVMVTHDQEEAMTMASRLAVMSEGKIVQIGAPGEVYEFPNSRFSAEFIGSTNLFEGRVVEDEPDHIFVESDDLEARMYVSHGVTGARHAGRHLRAPGTHSRVAREAGLETQLGARRRDRHRVHGQLLAVPRAPAERQDGGVEPVGFAPDERQRTGVERRRVRVVVAGQRRRADAVRTPR